MRPVWVAGRETPGLPHESLASEVLASAASPSWEQNEQDSSWTRLPKGGSSGQGAGASGMLWGASLGYAE